MTAITEEAVRTDTSPDESIPADTTVDGSAVDAVRPSDTTEQAGANAPASTESESFLKVLRGSPGDEEIAALIVVLSAAAAAAGGNAPSSHLPPESWGDPTRMHRGAAPFSPYAFPNVSSHQR